MFRAAGKAIVVLVCLSVDRIAPGAETEEVAGWGPESVARLKGDAWRVPVLDESTAGHGLPRPGGMFNIRSNWPRGTHLHCMRHGFLLRAAATATAREAFLVWS